MNSNTKTTLIIGALMLGAFLLFRANTNKQTPSSISTTHATNVAIVDGQQIVTITAKGGYKPTKTSVQAGIPTVLRVVTTGSYDCSANILIPTLGINKTLPATGSTDLNLGLLSEGTLQGTCSMGMYRFELDVQG